MTDPINRKVVQVLFLLDQVRLENQILAVSVISVFAKLDYFLKSRDNTLLKDVNVCHTVDPGNP